MDIIILKDTSNKLFYVGGVVRDELLGIKSLDVDIVYEGNAIDDCSSFGDLVRVNPDFGTIRVKLDGREVDIASTRTEKYPRKGHLPVVDKIGVSLKEDALRRDFTVNALYKSLSTGEIFDFTGGLEDLKNKTLCVLHEKSFVDDPTRILRALKFSHRFGFELSEKTRALRDEYLQNINYDMCFKRVKKELIETLGLNSQKLFEEFIESGIYKLVTPNQVSLPAVPLKPLVEQYAPDSENIWLIYAGVLLDLSRLELTRKEQKILDDFSALENSDLRVDFEIYKAFENVEIESIILYAALKNEKIARHYMDDLRGIKIKTTGKTLEMAGLEPSPKYKKIFDFLLRKKLENPSMTLDDEIKLVKEKFS
ncbi:CCA tRNA nucleotidyltransferase [bacterium]|nr:CCA tRNA nucleotidyltransferase [bacterium]